MIQFYAHDINGKGILPPDESLHCARVLRKKAGDEIFVSDGRGKRYLCRITDPSTRGVAFEVLSEEYVPKYWNFTVTIAVAVTKNIDRMSWLVEKATEIGVDRIIFLDCINNERRNINLDRLRRNALSAMNQSLKTELPLLEGLVKLKDFALQDHKGQKLFGYCDESLPRENLVNKIEPGENITVLIGPEGDFTPEEVKLLLDNGFQAVTFGEFRLRTETAALYALEAVHILNQLNVSKSKE